MAPHVPLLEFVGVIASMVVLITKIKKWSCIYQRRLWKNFLKDIFLNKEI